MKNNVIQYDESLLMTNLQKLPLWARVAFAASAAGRLLPAYRKFCNETGTGDSTKLSGALEFLWNSICGERHSRNDVLSVVDEVMTLTPSDDLADSLYFASADDAVAAVGYSLETLATNDVQLAAWAARRAYDAVDNYVIETMSLDHVRPSDRPLIRQDPLIQGELGRQQRDLKRLLQYSTIPAEIAAISFRNSLQPESAIPI